MAESLRGPLSALAGEAATTNANLATIITALALLHTDLAAINALLTTANTKVANLKPNAAVTGIIATAA